MTNGFADLTMNRPKSLYLAIFHNPFVCEMAWLGEASRGGSFLLNQNPFFGDPFYVIEFS